MPIILLTNCYSASVHKIAETTVPYGFELISLETNQRDELTSKAALADYILASGRTKINKTVLDAAVRLKMIQRTGVGLDSLDLGAVKAKDIPLYVNPGINASSVAEHTVMLMLASLRRLPQIDSQLKSGAWERQAQGVLNFELRGKTVGIVGVGNIGRTVAKLLRSFDVTLLYYDAIRMSEVLERDLGIQYVPLEQLISRVDILSLHCPLTPQTKKMINGSRLACMKKGAILINTARGGLVDEEALARSLRSGHTRAAGLDVYNMEPLPSNSPLMALQNIIITPHIGGITFDSFHAMMAEAMSNIALFEEGKFEQIQNRKLKL